jgi:hypothetical protein
VGGFWGGGETTPPRLNLDDLLVEVVIR